MASNVSCMSALRVSGGREEGGEGFYYYYVYPTQLYDDLDLYYCNILREVYVFHCAISHFYGSHCTQYLLTAYSQCAHSSAKLRHRGGLEWDGEYYVGSEMTSLFATANTLGKENEFHTFP